MRWEKWSDIQFDITILFMFSVTIVTERVLL